MKMFSNCETNIEITLVNQNLEAEVQFKPGFFSPYAVKPRRQIKCLKMVQSEKNPLI